MLSGERGLEVEEIREGWPAPWALLPIWLVRRAVTAENQVRQPTGAAEHGGRRVEEPGEGVAAVSLTQLSSA